MHFFRNEFLKYFPKVFLVSFVTILIILKPDIASEGIKNGINLLLSTVIPSLFPFLVLSSYIALSPAFFKISEIFKFPVSKLFKINQNGFIPVLLGITGGYPIGAKVTADLYKNNRLTQNEAERLLYFAVNSGPAFTITAVGTSILGNYYSGIILYASSVLTSFTIGFLLRFLSDKKSINTTPEIFENKEAIFIKSVASGANSAINISSWIMVFSCISALFNDFKTTFGTKLFVTSVLEVTSACKFSGEFVSLPVISAILGFGGLSVIFQVSPFVKECGVEMKKFVASRILNASLSAFFTHQLIKIFPKAVETVVFSVTEASVKSNTSAFLSVTILLLMCVILILQVDNRKKIC